MKYPMVLRLLTVAALCLGASAVNSADSAKTLTFQWPTGMRCTVEHWNVEGGNRQEPGRFVLSVKPAGEHLDVLISGYEVMPVNGEPSRMRGTRQMLNLSKLEREFTVSLAGAFVRAEPVENAVARIEKNKTADNSGIANLAMGAVQSEGRRKTYRTDWQTLAGAWVGLTIDPAATQKVELEPGVSASVTVSEVHPCPGSAASVCVTVKAEMTPPDFGGWSRFELEVEPGSLIPHLWIEQELMNDTQADGTRKPRVSRDNRRSYDCRAGS